MDGISLPEKILTNLLRPFFHKRYQRQITKRKLSWAKPYRYDGIVLPEIERYDLVENIIIIEMHGRHHYEEVNWGNSNHSKSLMEVQKSDKNKKELALSNGVKLRNYFEIDCRRSNLQYIRAKIMDSGLLTLLGIDPIQIDWNSIYEKSIKDIHLDIMQYAKENPNEPPQHIADRFIVSKSQVNNLLKEHGLHRKYDKSQRRDRSKQNEREVQVNSIKENNPQITGPEIAKKLGVHRSTIYEIERIDTDIDRVQRSQKNNEDARLAGLRGRNDKIMKVRIEKIRVFCENNPDYTRKKIAGHLGETLSWIHQVFKRYDIGVDMVRLKENETRDSLINRKAKGVWVTAPDGSHYMFDSVGEARRQLEYKYGARFPETSVRRYLIEGKDYNGYRFSNQENG